MLTVVIALVAMLLIVATVFVALSPGAPKPITAEAGRPVQESISEKIFIEINGIRQGIFIKSNNSENPVLLYLHGGMPDYFLTASTLRD
jgi:hypothetical protein